LPSVAVRVFRSRSVSTFFRLTPALATAAPVGSVTVPRKSVVACAQALPAANSKMNRDAKTALEAKMVLERSMRSMNGSFSAPGELENQDRREQVSGRHFATAVRLAAGRPRNEYARQPIPRPPSARFDRF